MQEDDILSSFVLGLREGLHAYPLEAPEESAVLPPREPVLGGPPDDFGGRGPRRGQGGASVGRRGGGGRGVAEGGPVADVSALVKRAHAVRHCPRRGRGGAAGGTVRDVDGHFARSVALDDT